MTSGSRPITEFDQRIFTFSDIQRLFRRQKKKILRLMIVGAVFGFCAKLILTPVQYEVTSTFREGIAPSGNDEASKIFGLLSGKTDDSQTMVMIQSAVVLKPLVQRMGVQATVPFEGKILKCFRRVKENLCSEMGIEVKDKETFSFRDVIYEGERPCSYGIRFESPDRFFVESGKEILARGSVGSRCSFQNISFTLIRVPKSLKLQHLYSLSLQSWDASVKQVLSQLSISTNAFSLSVYQLKFSHRERLFGMELLDRLLDQYRDYLKKDHDEAMKEQLSYLGQRQEEVYNSMSQVFDEHLASMGRSLKSAGQLDFTQEARSTGAVYQELAKRVFAIDIEIDQLNLMEKEQKMVVPTSGSPFFGVLLKVLNEMAELQQNRDWIELALPQETADTTEVDYEASREELQQIRKKRESLRHILESIDRGIAIEFFEPEKTLPFWASSLKERMQHPEDKEELAEYLEHYSRLLSMQENIVLQRISQEVPSEFKGIDFQTIKSLFLNYNQKLDESHGLVMQFARLKQEIGLEDFEVSSLGVILGDPLSRRLVERAITLALQLKDEKHRSERESLRWKEELTLHKKILADHLDQLYKVESLRAELLRSKILILQRMSLGSIVSQISILREKFTDLVKEHRSSLEIEKKSFEKKMEEMREHFADFPEKWKQEKWVDWKSEMGLKMMGAITELVESKTISSNLHRIGTKSLNPPLAPFSPKSPNLLMGAILGAIVAGGALFSYSLFRTILKGFPSSFEKLSAMQYPVLGKISSHCDGENSVEGSDLDLLRQISLFLDRVPRAQTIALLASKGPDYSYALGALLSKLSRKIVIVRCDFREKFHESQLPGLLQFWGEEMSEIPIRKTNGYDLLFSGGFTPYGTEVIRSEKFSDLLARLKKNYDTVFLLFRTPIDSIENLAVFPLVDKVVVTVAGEPTEQLTPFIQWGYHEGNCRIAMITQDFA